MPRGRVGTDLLWPRLGTTDDRAISSRPDRPVITSCKLNAYISHHAGLVRPGTREDFLSI
jgi:hypothetical protein